MENNNFNNRVDNYQPYGYRQENNTNEYFEKQQEKKNDKKILKTIGALCGFSIVIYFVASTLVGVTVAFLNKYLPNLDFVYEQGLGSWAFSSIATVLFIGLPFLATYIVLRKKKITGILPLGTTYNKKASTYLVVAFLPLTLLSTFLINFISLMVQSFMGVDFTSGMEDMAVTNVKDFLFMTLFVAVIPAILEEVAIRGVLLQPLRRFGDGFAVVGVITGAFTMTAVMVLANLLITPYYMGVPRGQVVEMIPTLLLPFNAIKAVVNGAVTLLIYKPFTSGLKRAGVLPRKTESEYRLNQKTAMLTLISLLTIAICVVVLITMLNGSFEVFRQL